MGLAEFVATVIQQDEEVGVDAFRKDLGGRPVLPSGSGSLADLRNAFSHYSALMDGKSDQSLAEAARSFLAHAHDFVKHLENPDGRIFPRVVRIESVTTDRWARRVVRAVDDEDIEEVIFTSTPVEPGEVYFMHPLTNPMRVDPILVPAGDLLGPAM